MAKKKEKETKKPKKTTKSGDDKRIVELEKACTDLKDQVSDLTDQVETLTTESKEQADKALRAMAELENFKKRKAQETQDMIKFGNERLINDVLPVMDSFELAMLQVERSESDEVQNMKEGLLMIQKQLQQFLEKAGVQRIDAMNQPFDPNLHQAVSKEASPDLPENTVVQEMQPGYQLNERVIRPSMVVVSTK